MATTIHLPEDFKEFLKLLNSKQVEYLLVGGYAVGYYGYPRPTGDLDIWIAISRENAEKTVAALRDFAFGPSDISADLFLKEKSVIRMGVPPFRIEIITSISGVSFQSCYPKRLTTTIGDTQVNLISVEDLKANKTAAGRLKDLNDLENLPEE